MSRELINSELTADNIEFAKLSKQVDIEDTLRRIASEWLSTRKKCSCASNAACSICEIDYLLAEAFEMPEQETARPRGCTHYGNCDC